MIVPEHIWSSVSHADARSTFRNDPPLVGTGPMIVSEFQQGQFARLTPNAHFRAGQPKIAGPIFSFFPSANSIAQGLKSGNLDYGMNLTAAQWSDLSRTKRSLSERDGPRLAIIFGAHEQGRVACHLYPAAAERTRFHQMGEITNIMALENLQVHFPGRCGMLSNLFGRPAAHVRAIDGVYLTVRRGEILAVVGESGSGKSTVGRVITKLVQPTGGKLVFDGKDMTSVEALALRPYRHRVQIIFQDAYQALNPRHTIFDIVAEGVRSLHLVSGHEAIMQRVAKSLASAGLNPPQDFFARFPHELSGGQRQRVVIAGALAVEPELIVADEPVSTLDVSIRAQILQVLIDLRTQRNMALLFITHDLPVAWSIADRIVVVYLGRIVEIGSADDITFNPKHPIRSLSGLPLRRSGR